MTDQRNEPRKDRRYRGDAVKHVKAVVETSAGQTFDGQLDDFSIAGAGIRFAANVAPPLKVGQIIIITLRLPLPTQQYHVADIQAEVRYFFED